MRKSFTFFVIIISATFANAQNFEWEAGFDGFLDNREYFSTENPQTIFGNRVRLEVGGSLSETHRLRAGLNYLYEFGHHIDAHKPDLTLYYQYNNEGLMLNFGSFPRKDLIDYPIALLSDTLNYFRPNIQGVYLSYSWDWGRENVFIDWTSRQTDIAPEQFIFALSGRMDWNFLFLTHHFMMGHMAGPGIPIPGHHLRDNGGFDVNLGTDLSEKIFIDTLLLSAGALVSLDRTRSIDDGFQTPAGFVGKFTAMHKGFGLSGLLYAGEGHTFLYGDPFYRLKNYGRLDIIVAPFRSGRVTMKIDWALHFAKGQLDHSQMIFISMTLDGSRPLRDQ
jgi:hypothetical protein